MGKQCIHEILVKEKNRLKFEIFTSGQVDKMYKMYGMMKRG